MGRFPSFFVIESKPLLQEDLEEYILAYEEYIKYICKKRGKFLKDQVEDMKSFIIMELIITYHKKYKYDDFDYVTRTIIRRKAIDFTSNFFKRNEDLVFENEYARTTASSTESGEIMNAHFIEKSLTNNKKDEETQKILATVKDIEFKINSPKYKSDFSDWAREFIEVVLELYEYGYDCDRDDIMACMGYEPNEVAKFNSKLLAFRNKLKEVFDIDSKTF